jgi:hypothetical protein
MPNIYPGGSADVVVPVGQKIVIGNFGSSTAIVYLSTLPGALPQQFAEVSRVTNAQTILGTYNAARTVRIEAGTDTVRYSVGVNPSITNYTQEGYTWATKPSAASSSGVMIYIKDIGSGGSLWISNGTTWRPIANVLTLGALTTRQNVAAGASETIVYQTLLPAAFLNVYDRLRLFQSVSKAGTTNTGVLTFRFGTAGTTSDTSVFSGSAISTSSRVIGNIHDFKVASATTLQHLGLGNTNSVLGSYSGSGTTAFPAAVTISDVSNALYFSIGITAGGTDDLALEDCYLQYIAAP